MLLPLLLVTGLASAAGLVHAGGLFGPRMGKHGRGAAVPGHGGDRAGSPALFRRPGDLAWGTSDRRALPIQNRTRRGGDTGTRGLGKMRLPGGSDTEQDAETGRRGDAGLGKMRLPDAPMRNRTRRGETRGRGDWGTSDCRALTCRTGRAGRAGWEHPSVAVAALSGTLYSLGSFGAGSKPQLLYRCPDDRHVLHGHPRGHLHPRLLLRLHARGAARRHRPAGDSCRRPAAGPSRPVPPLLPVPVALLLQHAGIGDRRQHRHGFCLLGAGRHLLVFPHRFLSRTP